jgi:hypothetical protein
VRQQWCSAPSGPGQRFLGVIKVNGTDDGWIVIVAALVAAGLVFLRQRRGWNLLPILVAELAAVVAAGVAIYDWNNLGQIIDESGLIQAGWGIYVATIGSVSLALACIGLGSRRVLTSIQSRCQSPRRTRARLGKGQGTAATDAGNSSAKAQFGTAV